MICNDQFYAKGILAVSVLFYERLIMMRGKMKLSILGTRGIPAKHGGFETFAERLALYLSSKGWKVTVYCQADGIDKIYEENWKNIRLVHIPVHRAGAIGTIIFDWKSTTHASREKGLKLTLGYNTAFFCLLYRIKGQKNLINMDGLEWKRAKWSVPEKAWLYLNERIGCCVGNHLIADHPEIKAHLSTRISPAKISMIPYCADLISRADAELLKQYELVPNQYIILIARPEPENSILEIVLAFSRKTRGFKLVILGHYEPQTNPYHEKVMKAAGDEVCFIGTVYEKPVIDALRLYARLYCHGHSVGGTNPSLVEALGAGVPVLAHGNKFNRWVYGPEGHYFENEDDCAEKLDYLLTDNKELYRLKQASLKRYHEEFTTEKVLGKYETLLLKWQ